MQPFGLAHSDNCVSQFLISDICTHVSVLFLFSLVKSTGLAQSAEGELSGGGAGGAAMLSYYAPGSGVALSAPIQVLPSSENLLDYSSPHKAHVS